MNDKELEALSKKQIIDLCLVKDNWCKYLDKDRVEKLDAVDNTIEYILYGKYQEAIELLLLTFYDGYIPMSIIQKILDRFNFPKEN